jgi:hypothetical protein
MVGSSFLTTAPADGAAILRQVARENARICGFYERPPLPFQVDSVAASIHYQRPAKERKILAHTCRLAATIHGARIGLLSPAKVIAALLASRDYLPQFLRGEPLFFCAESKYVGLSARRLRANFASHALAPSRGRRAENNRFSQAHLIFNACRNPAILRALVACDHLFMCRSPSTVAPRMSLNPLSPVTDYQSMLNRIFWFTSAAVLAGTWLLRLYLPELDRWLSQIDFTVALSGDKILPIPGGYLLPALAVGMLTRVYHLHARISDWLGIRECFDVEVILAEFAAQLAIDLAPVGEEPLKTSRHRIMRRAFYPFVGGPQPQIDPQLIEQALDAWSWLWIGIEATLVFTLAGFGLVAGGEYEVGLLTIGGTLLLAAISLPAMRSQCRRYAIAQVRAILADPLRAAAVRRAFTEAIGNHFAHRRAA